MMTAGLCSWWQQVKQHRVTILVGAIILAVVIALIIVGYRFDWTGFKGRALWDWLELLAILAIPLAVAWFTHREQQRDRKLEQRALLQKHYSNIVQAYNAAKRVRRLLRATAQCISPSQKGQMIMIEPYDKQMQALVDVQLQFETFKDDIKSDPILFPDEWRDINNSNSVICKLDEIEKFLGFIIDEYENLYKKRPNAEPTLPISEMCEMNAFIDAKSKFTKFFSLVREVRDTFRKRLTSE